MIGTPASRITRRAAVFVPIFHEWIRNRELNLVAIDVADYAHVPAGPGMMIVGHDAHYAVDNRENRLGLLYNRRNARSV